MAKNILTTTAGQINLMEPCEIKAWGINEARKYQALSNHNNEIEAFYTLSAAQFWLDTVEGVHVARQMRGIRS
jgi:hypothetical protein